MSTAEAVVTVEPIKPPEELTKRTSDALTWARGLVISNGDEYNAVVDNLKHLKTLTKQAVDFFKPMKQSADAAKKVILDAEKRVIGPLEEAEGIVKRAMLTFSQEQERIRRAEEARLQAEADERARKERERLEKEAAKLKTPELKEERLAQAQAVMAPVVSVASVVESVQGVATKKLWKARVTDFDKLPKSWCLPNQKALDDFAKSTKGQVAVEGVEFYFEESLAIRS
jgi:regulator of protease activity HflC (stomatin/prohibitin superfamily)